MNQNNTNILLEKYPKLFDCKITSSLPQPFQLFYFECGDGWFTLIDKLCMQIQGYIDHKRTSRAKTIIYNRALKKAINGDKTPLLNYYAFGKDITDWVIDRVEKDIEEKYFRPLPIKVRQIKVAQVKEKFGGLRFYYDNGDGNGYIDGLVSMAEAMSYVTCEVCGDSGKVRKNGYIRTLCDCHSGKDVLEK